MNKETIAVLISMASIIIASFTLGWNIYRDIILKAKIKVRFMIATFSHPNFDKSLKKFAVCITNFGPGKIQCTNICIRKFSIWKQLIKKREISILIHDPKECKLPCELDIGDEKNLLLKFDMCDFLLEDWTHIGVKDTFSRIHWAPKKDVTKLRQFYIEKIEKQKL